MKISRLIWTFSLLLCATTTIAQPKVGGMMYIGIWPRLVLAIDEAQGKVVDRIQLQTGTSQGLSLSYDKKKIYVTT